MKIDLTHYSKVRFLWIGLAVILLVVACFVISLFFTVSGRLVRQSGGAFDGVSQLAPAASQPVVDDFAFEESMAEPLPTAAASGSTSGFGDGASIPIEEYLANAVTQVQDLRVIIYTGNISLVIRDTREAMDAITQIANEQGGFTSGSNIFQSGEALRGSMTIRVPAERYQDTMTQLRDLALRVEQENTSTQDVTEEFTDLQARKQNLEFAEDALQKLLEERQRIGSTSDILEVHRELTNIRGQVEQIEGRLRYLANQAALSTITIELTPDILYQPISVAGWEPQGVAREALQALVAALQGLVNILIWFVIFILPLLVVLLIPVVIAIMLIRWWLKRRKRREQAAEEGRPSKPEAQE